jgi:UDP-glucose 4-epimerase
MGSAPHTETSPLRPQNNYGNYHAWAEERLSEALKDRLTILRLANIYGPRQRMKSGQGFITAAVRALEMDQPLIIYGNGSTVRDYIHETDVVMLVRDVIKIPRSGVFNVASGQGTDQRTVVSFVEKSFRRTLRIHYEASRLSGIQANILSTEKAKNVFGWKAATNLQDGIETYKEAY